MNKEKIFKIATSSILAASSFVAAAPFTTEAAVNINVSVNNAVAQALKAHQTYTIPAKIGHLTEYATVQKELTLAQNDYNSSKALVNKYGGKQKAYYLSKLASAAKYISYVQGFIKGLDTIEKMHDEANKFGATSIVNDSDNEAFIKSLGSSENTINSLVADTATKNLLIKVYLSYSKTLSLVISAYEDAKSAELALTNNDQGAAKKRLDETISLLNGASKTNFVNAVSIYVQAVQLKYNQSVEENNSGGGTPSNGGNSGGTTPPTGNNGSGIIGGTTDNQAPVATNLQFRDPISYGYQELIAEYTYTDAERDIEGVPIIQWYRCTEPDGSDKVAISGATKQKYITTSADIGKYIFFEVTPIARTGSVKGTAVISSGLQIPIPYINIQSDGIQYNPLIFRQSILNKYASKRDNGYTIPGATNTSIPLSWGDVKGAKSYAIIMHDPRGGEWINWAVVNIPAETTSLPEGVSGNMPAGIVELNNSWSLIDHANTTGYDGPLPPLGIERDYVIDIYALDTSTVDVLDQPKNDSYTFDQLTAKFAGHIVGRGTCMGNFAIDSTENQAPVATNIGISGYGSQNVGSELIANYTYTDAENDLEGVSKFQWYRSTKSDGSDKVAISGATRKRYTLTTDDIGKYILFEVTPVASTGTNTGTTVLGYGGKIDIPNLWVDTYAFERNQLIPDKYASTRDNGYTISGATNTSIPLSWGQAIGAKSYAIIMHDPQGGEWIHWAVVNIPAEMTSLPEGISGYMPAGIVELNNSWSKSDNANTTGYDGPLPPKGSGEHDYTIDVYALDIPTLDVSDQPTNDSYTLDQLTAKFGEHVIGKGTFRGYYQVD
jgi:Raf kinase inhibitor-like YbhB/YbcL family protein